MVVRFTTLSTVSPEIHKVLIPATVLVRKAVMYLKEKFQICFNHLSQDKVT